MKKDGNIIYADFAKPPINASFNYELIYCDEYVALGRITYYWGERSWVQHIMTELKSD
jgi:hypothetical protein